MPAQKKQPPVQPRTLKTLLAWTAPERLFKKRSREYFSTIGAIVFLLVVILLFLKEWFLILTIIALAFVVYIMATIEPRKVKHEITTKGIVTGGRKYDWEELGRFWFTEKWGQKILHIEALVRLPRQLMMILSEINKAQVEKILSQYLSSEEPEKTWIDNAGEWLSRRVPLEFS